MGDILIARDPGGGTAILTTRSPLCRYGTPVLRIEADDIEGDYVPADVIGDITAAQIVAGWAVSGQRTPDELEAVGRYLSQWPEGPQIRPRKGAGGCQENLRRRK